MCDVKYCRSREEVVKHKGKGLCFKHYGLAKLGKINLSKVLR